MRLRPSPAAFWVALLLALEGVLAGRMVAERRIGGHDGLFEQVVRWFFLNSHATGGPVPHWLPFASHGMVGSWWGMVQDGIFQSALLFVPGSVVALVPFLVLSQLGVLVDHGLLLLGTWLLARRELKTLEGAFFVTAAVLASTIWFAQPWFELHLIYAVPLVLVLVHDWVEKGRALSLVLAANLVTLQGLATPGYFLPVQAFAVGVMFALYAARNHGAWLRAVWARTRAQPGTIALAAVAAAVPIALILVFTIPGTDEVVFQHGGRESDRSVTLATFFSYGGRPGHAWETHWLELFVRSSYLLDRSGYVGALTAGFAVFALFRKPDPGAIRWLCWTVILAAFAQGTALSAAAFGLWPGMSYYRHLGLAGAFVRVGVAFLGGHGFDRFVRDMRDPAVPRRRSLLAASAAIGITAVLALLLPGQKALTDYNEWSLESSLRVLSSLDAIVLSGVLGFLAVSALGLGAVASFTRWPQRAGVIIAALLALHAGDLYFYKNTAVTRRTVALDASQAPLFDWGPVEWQPRRVLETSLDGKASLVGDLDRRLEGDLRWPLESLLLRDALGSRWRVDYWHQPLDDLLRACAGVPEGASANALAEVRTPDALVFPETGCDAGLVAGVTADKVRFYRAARRLPTTTAVAKALAQKDDALYLLDPAAVPSGTGEQMARESIAITSVRFDTNEAVFLVAAPVDGWLYDAEAWHRWWRATVDGAPVTIERANLAYRAVPVPAGTHEVRFAFHAPWLSWAHRFAGLEGLLWTAIVAVGIARLFVVRHGPA